METPQAGRKGMEYMVLRSGGIGAVAQSHQLRSLVVSYLIKPKVHGFFGPVSGPRQRVSDELGPCFVDVEP